MKIVGYTVYGQDNDTYMFRDNSLLNPCPICKYRRNFFATNPEYRLKRRVQDLSATYDLQWIVSRAFKETCERLGLPGIEFGVFQQEPNYFHLKVTREIVFDAERRKTRFINQCIECGNYESIVGASPAFLKINAPLSEGVFRTDLLFGSGNSKCPVSLVASITKDAFEKARLKGLEFEPAYGLEE